MPKGGKREGAGRNPLPHEEKLKPLTVWIGDEGRDWCKAQPGGASAYIRALVEADRPLPESALAGAGPEGERTP